MKRQFLIFVSIIICLISSTLLAQENCYYKADREIQLLYEHFESISLKEAISRLSRENATILSDTSENDVSIQVNGGGPQNHLYIGRENVIEILVKNNIKLGGASWGFELSSGYGMHNFTFLAGHGGITTGGTVINGMIKIHDEIFDAGGNTWATSATFNEGYATDTLILGGTTFPNEPGFNAYLPSRYEHSTIYSFKIYVPDDTSLLGEQLCIDNIFFPPAGDWIFVDSSRFPITPNYQDKSNTSDSITDAPPVCFNFAEPLCESYSKSSNSKVVPLNPEDIRTEKPLFNNKYFEELPINKDGNRLIEVTILFEEKQVDLSEYVESSSPGLANDKYMIAIIPLNILPLLCQNSGIRNILLVPPLEEFLR